MLVAVWIITFMAIIGVGVYAGRKIKSANQWSGGDKTMGAVSLGCVFAAWQIGGMAIVGAAQNGYNLGISGAWYSIAGSFYFIALAVFAKIIRERMPGESVPAYLHKRFDVRTTRLYSFAWIIYGFLYIPIQIKTVASIIQIVLPGMNLMAAMLIGVTIAVLYTSFSGMRGASAVGRVVCIGIYVLLIAFTLTVLPQFDGLGGLFNQLPKNYDSMGNMPTQKIVAWILGGCISTAVMQAVLQPLLAAKSPQAARTGSILGYLIAAPICFFTAICGMLSKASGADLGDGSTAFAYAIKTFSSPVFGGVIFAYLTLIPAFLIPSQSLTNLFLTLQHVAAAPVSFAILVGLMWKRCTKQGAFWSMLTGMTTGILWMVLGLTDIVEAVYPVVLVTYSVGIIVSLMTSKKEIV